MKTLENQTTLTTPVTVAPAASPGSPRSSLPAAPATTSLPELKPFSCSKVAAAHLEKLAIVYVRQSSPQQVLENRESTARQYALADYAHLLGWPRERILVIDEDLGRSGRFAENRSGFQRLLAEVSMEHAGLVLALEVSRLSRSSRDWNQLFELCGVFGTLLADHDGVYDASDPNDRLILGLKGIMSEMELQTMRNRLDRGRINRPTPSCNWCSKSSTRSAASTGCSTGWSGTISAFRSVPAAVRRKDNSSGAGRRSRRWRRRCTIPFTPGSTRTDAGR